jgi:DNA-binding response OmpR family regulator
VVIVEDDADVAEALRLFFGAAGYEAHVANSAAAAVAACKTAAERGTVADLMLLDLSLPDAGGLTALAAATASGVRPRVTIALTGHTDPGTAAECRAAGCRDVIVKPVAMRELVARAAVWLA